MRMENRRNYYRILHVQRDAPVEIIKTSYRTLMQRLKMHPDLGGDHWQASLINEAFATLSDPEKRAQYDGGLLAPSEEVRDCENTAQTTDWANSTGRFCPFCATPHRCEDLPEQDCRVCGSPLSMSSTDNGEFTLQRHIARMPKSFPIDVYSNWPDKSDTGLAVDISPAGMCFSTGAALPNGKIIKIDSERCTAIAQVRHCELAELKGTPRYEIGVQFLTLRFNSTQGNFVSVVA